MSWWRKLLKKESGSEAAETPAEAAETPAGAAETPSDEGCDHGAIELRQGSADFEWFIARGELEAGNNLAHGASHLANLLGFDPGNPEWVDLLHRYLAAAGPNPEKLIPRGEEAYYTTEALRAYLWHREGRLADACELLASVARAKPDSRYLEAWALDWLEPAGAVESLPEQTGLFLFSQVLNRFPEARLTSARRLREIRRWSRLCDRFARVYPGDGMTGMLRAGLFRKAGLFEEAEAVVRPALERTPSWHLATALGLILRQKDDVDGAEQAFELALRLDPTDMSARLEAGDTFFERELWQRALGWYENALKKERRHEWAHPSALFCRWMLTEDERHLKALIELANKGNGRAQQLVNQAYVIALPEPVDATANVLRQLRDSLAEQAEQGPGGSVKLSISSIEAPSNTLAFQLEMAALGADLQLETEVEAIPQPDPRQPITEVRYLLWRYEGTDPFPALPPPAPDVVEQIREIALAPYDEDRSWAAASHAAEALGPDRAGEILAVMVHPPPVPEGSTALAWLPRVQQTAAHALAHLDEGWDGSVRREALLSALHGPQDWATIAAIRALARLGQENEAFSPQIGEAFQLLADHRPEPSYCCWEYPLYQYWVSLPHLFPGEREELHAKLQQIEAEDAEE
ncbi:MAG: repeat protein [Armatimonadetes bacterium]|nr:repeat protein [Armatimonadota bacterium]